MASSPVGNVSVGSFDVPSVLKSLPPTAESLAQSLPSGDQQALAHLVVVALSMPMEQAAWESKFVPWKKAVTENEFGDEAMPQEGHETGLVAVPSKSDYQQSAAFINTQPMPERRARRVSPFSPHIPTVGCVCFACYLYFWSRCSASPHSCDIDCVLELLDESNWSPPAEASRVDSKPESKQVQKAKGKGKKRTPEKIEEEKEATHLGRTQGKLSSQNQGKEEARKRGKGKSRVASAEVVKKPSSADAEKSKDPAGEGSVMDANAVGDKVLPGSYALKGEEGLPSIVAEEGTMNEAGLNKDCGGYGYAISQGGKQASKKARRKSKKVVPLNAVECSSSSPLPSSTTQNDLAAREASSRRVVGRIDQHICSSRNAKERGFLSRLCPHAFVGFADRLIDLLSGRM